MITDTEAREMWPVDTEWVALILNAREIGLTIEEIRQFLNEAVSVTRD